VLFTGASIRCGRETALVLSSGINRAIRVARNIKPGQFVRNIPIKNILGYKNSFLFAVAWLIVSAGATTAQPPRAADPGYRTGVLPRSWTPSGPKCVKIPEFQIHQYNEDLFILRQSGCTNYEKPFLYLLFGTDKVMLLDTGAGNVNVAQAVKRVIDGWLVKHKLKSIKLIVAHTHAHGDHIAGDDQFRRMPNAVFIAPELRAVQSFFGIKKWPEEIVQYDLGKRILDIIPIPGHEATSIAIYDRQTALLFSGDTLYPGRLYINEPGEYVRSIKRLVDFTKGKLVAHILGCHIENTRTPYRDYPIGTVYQPDEHVLELGRSHLLELNDALERMNGTVVRKLMRDFTIWP
jgi:glyoxylase-like metal-dependent hydrolase (beta-lactamase superfamily II)